MKKSNLKKLTVTAILAAVAVVGSLFSFPVFGSKCAPVQHLVNILCAVTVGPWWALAQAFIASLIRNLLGLGSPLAFPGSMCGALLAGLLYHYIKKLPAAYIGEVFGTAVIGGMLSYPVAAFIMGSKGAALFTFVVPFLIRLDTNAAATPYPGPSITAQSTFIRCCTGAHFDPKTGNENNEPTTATAAKTAVNTSFFNLIFSIFPSSHYL